MRRRVVITGLGCISPLGNDETTLWGNITSGKSGVGMITHYDTSAFKVKIGAEVKDFDAAALFGIARSTPDGSFYAIWFSCSSPSS